MSAKKKVIFQFDEEVSPGRFESRGLIGRIGKRGHPDDYGSHDWVSRDYAMNTPCLFTRCPINREGHCSVPSSIKIGADASCTTGRDLVNKPTTHPTRTVCKWCGGEIKQTYNGSFPNGWKHVGEKMSHPAEPRQ